MRFHPRIVLGTVSGAILILAIFLAIFIPRWIDRTRHDYEKALRVLEPRVAEIRDGRRMQLDKEGAERFANLLSTLGASSEYDDLKERLSSLQAQLLTSRQLAVSFLADPKRPDAQTPEQAKLELELAVGSALAGTSPAWHVDRSGLQVSEWQQATLKPYGVGTLFTHLVLAVPSGYNGYLLAVQENDDRQHLAAFRLIPAAPGPDGQPQGVLQLIYQEDEKPTLVLRQERVLGGRLSLALELTAAQVRAWVGSVVSVHPVRGLRDNAPAAIGVTLPKDAVVERLVVSPKVAR